MEVRVLTAQGIRLYLKTARRLEIDGVPYLASFGIDITERKQAEKAHTNEEELFDAMIESAPGVFYVINAEGDYYRRNYRFDRLTGHLDRELQSRPWLLTILEND